MNSENPYAAPAHNDSSSAAFLAENFTAIPFRGILQAMRGGAPLAIAVPLAMLFRLRHFLKWPLKAHYAMGPVGSGWRIDTDEIPRAAWRTVGPVIEELEQLGFELVSCHKGNVIGAKVQIDVLMVDSKNDVLAQLDWYAIPDYECVLQELALEFNSFPITGDDVLTCRVNPDHIHLAPYVMPDFVNCELFGTNDSVEYVYFEHLDRIENQAVQRLTPGNALAVHRQSAQRRSDAVLANGIFRELSAAEIK